MTQAPRARSAQFVLAALCMLLAIAIAMIVVGFVARQRLVERWDVERSALHVRIADLLDEKARWRLAPVPSPAVCPICPTCPQVTAPVMPRQARPSLAEVERAFGLGHLDCRTLSGP